MTVQNLVLSPACGCKSQISLCCSCASPVQNLGTTGGTGGSYWQVQAHLGAEGWDGAKPWWSATLLGEFFFRINAIFCSHRLGFALSCLVNCSRVTVETLLSLLPNRMRLPQAERGFPSRHTFLLNTPHLFSPRGIWDLVSGDEVTKVVFNTSDPFHE